MKEYVILTNIYKPLGGFYKYAPEPQKEPLRVSYKGEELKLFVEKWKHIIESEAYYDPPKTFVIDFEKVVVEEITDKLNEYKELI